MKSKPEYRNDEVVSEETHTDARETIRERRKDSMKERSNSAIDTRKVETFNDQNNNYTREIKDLPKTEVSLGKELKHNGKSERTRPGNEGKVSRGHGNSFHRKVYSHGSQQHSRQNPKEPLVDKTSTLGDSGKLRDMKRNDFSKNQDAEATCKSAMDKEEKSPVESIAVSNGNEANGKSNQPAHNQQRRSSDKTDKFNDRLPKKGNSHRRYNRRHTPQSKGEGADLHKEYSNEQSEKTRHTRNSPQKIQKKEEKWRAEGNSAKIHGNLESETRSATKQKTKEVRRSWADEVMPDNSVNCNGHID